MDPLQELNAHIIDEIFQHLTVQDLLLSSLVSQSWYDFIADSTKCMKRIIIKISIKGLLMGQDFVGIENLKKSRRQYENLMMYRLFDFQTNNGSLLQLLSDPERQWKWIKMHQVKFEKRETFQKVLGENQNTVETLHLDQVKFDDITETSSYLNYNCSKLKELTLISCPFYNEFFINSNNLTTLHLVSNYGFVKASMVANFQELLYKNKNLHTLLLSGNIITQLFCDDISEKIQFKLKEFKITNFNVDKFHNRDVIEKNINLFLETQLYIEKIFLGEWMGVKIWETVFNEMKFLKDLTLMEVAKATTPALRDENEVYIQEEDDEEEQMIPTNLHTLRPNPSIVKLDYQDIGGNIYTLKYLLEAAPNLRSFSSYSLNQEMLQMLAHMMTNLEYLSVSFFDALDIGYLPIFPKLKDFAALRVDEELTQQISFKKFCDRNNFEHVLYNCYILDDTRRKKATRDPNAPFDFTSEYTKTMMRRN